MLDRGTLIWAIDQDDKKFSALQAVTGVTDIGILQPNGERKRKLFDSHSSQFQPTDCFRMQECNAFCPEGFTKMTDVYIGPGDKDKRCKRAYCCPSFGAPNPADCTWRGGHPPVSDCNPICAPGEIRLVGDDQGSRSRPCGRGGMAFCCKISNSAGILGACALSPECGSDNCGAGPKSKAISFVYDKSAKCVNSRGNPTPRAFCCTPEVVSTSPSKVSTDFLSSRISHELTYLLYFCET